MLKILVQSDYGAHQQVWEYSGDYDQLLDEWGDPEFVAWKNGQWRDLTPDELDGLNGPYTRACAQYAKGVPEDGLSYYWDWQWRRDPNKPYYGSRGGHCFEAHIASRRFELSYFDAIVYTDDGDASLQIAGDSFPSGRTLVYQEKERKEQATFRWKIKWKARQVMGWLRYQYMRPYWSLKHRFGKT